MDHHSAFAVVDHPGRRESTLGQFNEVHDHSTRHVLTGPDLREEGVERTVIDVDPLVRPYLLVWPEAMLEALQLSRVVATLETRMACMDRYHLPHS
jgi:hypothetical protein